MRATASPMWHAWPAAPHDAPWFYARGFGAAEDLAIDFRDRARPHVITREQDGVVEEPWELVAVDIETRHQGPVMPRLGERGGELTGMRPDSLGRVRLDYRIPSRGLIGFQSEFRSQTSGSGLIHHVFERYAPVRSGSLAQRASGVLVSNGILHAPALLANGRAGTRPSSGCRPASLRSVRPRRSRSPTP